ncbi:mitochondrial carrier [Dendrothele bispora CBS 962.96]|uniref:Mitochondrial carrier n=1 Tax=Dendrothele bispora (strain CBS 962.96) TaxID=1314807 RepID=A0A4S8MWU3_DENBC|nr:mitochondrial carrier [Dendrothele bispora CBS 962.96]
MPASIPFWLGGVAASMASSCTHPLDLTKVRMQTMEVIPGSKPPNMFTVFRSTLSDSGVRSLYTGLSASLLRQMSYSLVRLGTYEEFKSKLSIRSEDGKPRKPKTYELLAAACLAGALGGIAGNPADILLVRMTSDLVKPPEQRYNYSNAINGLIRLATDEGPKALARGLGTNVVRAILMNASQVGSYDFFKTTLINKTIPILDYQLRDSLPLHALASVMAGTFATTVCSPADVIRSRLMSSSTNRGPLEILKTSLRTEGVSFLFKGWTPAFIRLGPNTVLLFIFFEQLKQGWRTFHETS